MDRATAIKILRLGGLAVVLGYLALTVFLDGILYWGLQLPHRVVLVLWLAHSGLRLVFIVWCCIFLWLWYQGDFKSSEDGQGRPSALPNPRIQILFWLAIALLLVVAFNVVPMIVHDQRVAGSVLSLGAMALMVVVWGAVYWMTRRRKVPWRRPQGS
ncbi:MAG: hypothetical protein KGJ78_12310 [Alphaproteobacteria bacterium]|nr:hypothetical protein [Alphaproteobacteria bacterium]